MNACGVRQFEITKGALNEFTFVIKKNNSTMPIQIYPEDTFKIELIRLSDNTTADLVKNPIVIDPDNGKILFIITEQESNTLLSERGPQEDRYYNKATYKLVIEGSTKENGSIVATVSKVYVK